MFTSCKVFCAMFLLVLLVVFYLTKLKLNAGLYLSKSILVTRISLQGLPTVDWLVLSWSTQTFPVWDGALIKRRPAKKNFEVLHYYTIEKVYIHHNLVI